MFGKNKKRYIAIFLMKEGNSYSVSSKKRISKDTKIINYNKETPIPINMVNCSFTKGLYLYYYISITEKRQLFFENTKGLLVGHKALSMLINDEIVSQITSNLNKSNYKMSIINMIFSALFGGLIGFIIGGYI